MISKRLALKLATEGKLRVNGVQLDFRHMRARRILSLRGNEAPLLYVPHLPDQQSDLDRAILSAITEAR